MYTKHLISKDTTVRQALQKLDELKHDAILFVTDHGKLIGSITDGDLRRGFIKGLGFEDEILSFVQPNPEFIYENEFDQNKLETLRKKNYKLLPILNRDKMIVDILNFRVKTTLLPVDAVLMAGGKGARLRPLTNNTPKPLLKVGEKPIIEYNIDRLAKVGVNTIYLSINYLGEQLESYFGDGTEKNISIKYIRENKPLGTIGSVMLVDDFQNEEIIVMNSDLLTNIDFADFYKAFKEADADMAVASVSYHVDIPYAVLEADETQKVQSLKEKPRYTYFSNAGIYLLKTKILEMIPRDEFFDITTLMDKVIEMDCKLITYPINGYWLDIGRMEDYKKAQDDIKHIQL